MYAFAPGRPLGTTAGGGEGDYSGYLGSGCVVIYVTIPLLIIWMSWKLVLNGGSEWSSLVLSELTGSSWWSKK